MNPEYVDFDDKSSNNIIIGFTEDETGDEILKIKLSLNDAKRLKDMLIHRTSELEIAKSDGDKYFWYEINEYQKQFK
jgi:hypothetical protein